MRCIIASMLLGVAVISFLEWLVVSFVPTLDLPHVQLALFLLIILSILIASAVAAPLMKPSK